jgi:hypothetical protein
MNTSGGNMGSVEEGVWGSGFEWGECVKLCGESFFLIFAKCPSL